MENSIPEFDDYINALSGALTTSADIRQGICLEVKQSLYDKYNEYLVKGYGLENSAHYTINTFEEPVKLARMFNKVYKEGNTMPNVKKIIYNKPVIISSFVVIFLMTVYGFFLSLNNFIILAGKDYGSIGWHAIDSNVINGLLLSTTLLVLYVGCLYNIILKKLLPPKIVIWTAYINLFLVMFFNFATK